MLGVRWLGHCRISTCTALSPEGRWSENDIRISAENPWMREKSIWPNCDLAMALVGWGQCGRTSTDYTLLVQKHPVMTPVNLHLQNEGF